MEVKKWIKVKSGFKNNLFLSHNKSPESSKMTFLPFLDLFPHCHKMVSCTPSITLSHNHIKNKKVGDGRWREETFLSFLLSQKFPADFPLHHRPELRSQERLRMQVLGIFCLCCGRYFCQPGRQGRGGWPWEGSQQCLPGGFVAMVAACALPVSNGQWAKIQSVACHKE